jgi:hypothetical protein
MESAIAQRIAQVIARHNRERASPGSRADQLEQQRRLARDHVVTELPHFASTISSTVAELNDRISDAGLRIKFETADQLPSAEAIYTFSVTNIDREGPVLSVSVDYKGVLRAILRGHDARSLLLSSTLFTISESDLMNLLVTLLEAQYD